MSEISGFGTMGPLGGEYEGTCQAIKRITVEWFKAHPEVEEPSGDMMPFVYKHRDLYKAICALDPSAAQAGGGFWAGVQEVFG